MTIPNILTLVRMALVPVFMVVALSTPGEVKLAAMTIFIIASLTDAVDGYIARKYNQITTFGKFMDPLADKLLVTSALLVFIQHGQMPAWAVMIILGRELAVTSLRMVAAADGLVIQAAFWGKLKTLVQVIGIAILMSGLGAIVIYNTITVGTVTVWAMVFVAVMSGYDYIKSNLDVVLSGLKQGGKSK